MSELGRLLEPALIGTLIPIVAIVACAALAIARMWFRHRERLAMIEMGLDPDHDPPPPPPLR